MEWTPRTPRNYLEIDYLFTYRNYRIKITIQDENNSTIYTSILYPVSKNLIYFSQILLNTYIRLLLEFIKIILHGIRLLK